MQKVEENSFIDINSLYSHPPWLIKRWWIHHFGSVEVQGIYCGVWDDSRLQKHKISSCTISCTIAIKNHNYMETTFCMAM